MEDWALGEWHSNFGFLPKPWTISDDTFAIHPLPDYTEKLAWVEQRVSAGYLNPPVKLIVRTPPTHGVTGEARTTSPIRHVSFWKTVSIDDLGSLDSQWEVDLNSVFSDDVVSAPLSHELIIKDNSEDNPRLGLASFVLQILGLTAGTRLQFENWCLDRRIPFMSGRGLPLQQHRIGWFISTAIKKYLSLEQNTRTALSNALYILNMSQSTDWDWEIFFYCFMALDGIRYALGIDKPQDRDCEPLSTRYKAAELSVGLTLKRIIAMSRTLLLHLSFDGCHEDDLMTKSTAGIASTIVKLRNDLIHQTNWAGLPPGHASDEYPKDRIAFFLRNLVKRAAVALLVGPNKYSRSSWISLGCDPFIEPSETAT
jgi:hypothetical protein